MCMYIVRQMGSTALMLAAAQGRTDTVRLLLEHGADVDHANNVSAACVWGKCIKGIKQGDKDWWIAHDMFFTSA